MRDILTWLQETGFYTKTVWNIETEKWIGPGLIQLYDFQKRILGHCFTIDPETGLLPYSTVVWSAPKKSGKTQIEALVGAWVADEYPESSELYVVANDLEQAASRAFADLEDHYASRGIGSTQKRIQFENGTYIQVLAQHFASAAGARQALTLFDELWAFTSERSRRMWAEMTPPPTVPNSFRFIGTYAGYANESDQLMALYNMCFAKDGDKYMNGEVVPELADIVDDWGDPVCRRNGKTFIYWDTVGRFPWQNESYYNDQLTTLRPADFLRMHKNRWATSSESFIPMEWWTRAAKKMQLPVTLDPTSKYRSYPLHLGIDIGVKHDTLALVGTTYDLSNRAVILLMHKIWKPVGDGQMLDIEKTVEDEIVKLFKNYHLASVCYDPYQFQRSSVSLARIGVPMVEFPQSVTNMTAATSSLYEVLRNGVLWAYPSEELEDHLKNASVDNTNRGFRLTKGKNAKYAIDAAVALAMSVHSAIREGGVDTSSVITIESPFADASAWVHTWSQEQMAFPPELRN